MKLLCQTTTRVTLIIIFSFVLFACSSVQQQERDDKLKFQIADTDVRLGLGYLERGREEEALKKFKKAIKAMPDYAEAHSSIALAYIRLRQPEKAAEHYRRAVDLKPEDGSIQNNYAVFLCSQKQYVEAEQHFLTAIQSRKYRTPARALENLGVCMMESGDLKKSEGYLRKALKINPRLPGALLQMAKVSVEKKNLMSGRAYLQRYQEVAPLGPEGLLLGIQVERKLGDKHAEEGYKALLRKKYADSDEMRLLLELEDKERTEASRK